MLGFSIQAPTVGNVSFVVVCVSFFFGLVVAAARHSEFFRQRFLELQLQRVEELEKYFGHPVLGVLPAHTGYHSMLEAVTTPQSLMSECCQTLAHAVLKKMDRSDPCIMVTSATQGDGKTTVSFALALIESRAGKKVLLIDADLRRPNQHYLFSVDQSAGLSNVLSGSSFEDAVHRAVYPNLDFLAAGPIPPSAPSLIRELPTLLDQLRESYELIIIDTPPVLALADAPTVASSVKNIVFLASVNRLRYYEILSAIHRLMIEPSQMVAIALNRIAIGDFAFLGMGWFNYYGEAFEPDTRQKRNWRRFWIVGAAFATICAGLLVNALLRDPGLTLYGLKISQDGKTATTSAQYEANGSGDLVERSGGVARMLAESLQKLGTRDVNTAETIFAKLFLKPDKNAKLDRWGNPPAPYIASVGFIIADLRRANLKTLTDTQILDLGFPSSPGPEAQQLINSCKVHLSKAPNFCSKVLAAKSPAQPPSALPASQIKPAKK